MRRVPAFSGRISFRSVVSTRSSKRMQSAIASLRLATLSGSIIAGLPLPRSGGFSVTRGCVWSKQSHSQASGAKPITTSSTGEPAIIPCETWQKGRTYEGCASALGCLCGNVGRKCGVSFEQTAKTRPPPRSRPGRRQPVKCLRLPRPLRQQPFRKIEPLLRLDQLLLQPVHRALELLDARLQLVGLPRPRGQTRVRDLDDGAAHDRRERNDRDDDKSEIRIHGSILRLKKKASSLELALTRLHALG